MGSVRSSRTGRVAVWSLLCSVPFFVALGGAYAEDAPAAYGAYPTTSFGATPSGVPNGAVAPYPSPDPLSSPASAAEVVPSAAPTPTFTEPLETPTSLPTSSPSFMPTADTCPVSTETPAVSSSLVDEAPPDVTVLDGLDPSAPELALELELVVEEAASMPLDERLLREVLPIVAIMFAPVPPPPPADGCVRKYKLRNIADATAKVEISINGTIVTTVEVPKGTTIVVNIPLPQKSSSIKAKVKNFVDPVIESRWDGWAGARTDIIDDSSDAIEIVDQ